MQIVFSKILAGCDPWGLNSALDTPEEGYEMWGACSTLLWPCMAILRDSPWETDPPWGRNSSATVTLAVVTAEWKEMATKEISLARDSNSPWQRAKPRGKPLCAPHLPAWWMCSQIPKSCHVAFYLLHSDSFAALAALSSDPAPHTSNNSYKSSSLSLSSVSPSSPHSSE